MPTIEVSNVGDILHISIRIALVQYKGNQRPHFSVTADVWEWRDDTSAWPNESAPFWPPTYFGMCHEHILRARPDLQDVVTLHLADDNGVPLYALENGHYYLTYTATTPEDDAPPGSLVYGAEVVAQHFRIPVADVAPMRAWSRETLAAWVESQKPRWAKEADAVIQRYGLKVEYA